MLTAAFSKMADGVRNHASEFLPGGCCAPEAERRVRVGAPSQEGPGSHARDYGGEEAESGTRGARTREEKRKEKRAKRAARAAEKVRIQAVVLATLFSELKVMSIELLQDQLKKRKLLGGKVFTVSYNDLVLEDGDSGIDGRSVKRKAAGTGTRKGKAKKGVVSYMDYEWTEEEADNFEVKAIVGKVVADGATAYANQGKVNKGTILYRIVWRNYSPDLIWYEPVVNIGVELRDEYEERCTAEAAEEETAAADEADLKEMEDEEELPAP
ncbi:hypothetical protein AB1Y20_022526 [Prymnesium parvum]|uniref:Chromo domain-containing protein n=1 Tax=Prymnesium parvum TaxID=97485 RepID=A0AB34JHF2_PRYPA